nr:NAD+ synthase [Phycisphaerae bacterium]
MRIAIGQFNAVVGDLRGNVDKMRGLWQQATDQGAQVVVFPELAVCGYPPEDLLHKRCFLQDNRLGIERLAAECPHQTLIAGFADSTDGLVCNAAAVIQEGRIRSVYHKGRLPNFGVFDESRYFEPGTQPLTLVLEGLNTTLTICYDLWAVDWLSARFSGRPLLDLVVNLSASPFEVGKFVKRRAVVGRAAVHFRCPVAYCNLVGGQDELVFDGRSLITDAEGQVVCRAKAFDEDLLIADLIPQPKGPPAVRPLTPCAPSLDEPVEEVYHALVLGTRDYVRKNGFEKTLIGVSGGVDSALTLAIAVAALGPSHVTAVTMPSRFSSQDTLADAQAVARNLGVRLITLPIESILAGFHKELSAVPGWDNRGLAYENLQARIRGTLLMSLSNQLGALVLTTGNKSEASVGYSTLYGDTAGGFAVIKDVPKTLVYELANYVNSRAARPVIPQATIARPPTAELRPNQKDSDALPEYEVLDPLIKGYVEQDKSPAELIQAGFPEAVVRKVVRMVDRSEYKRRQYPPGVRVTTKAFGKDRRLPITNRYDSSGEEGIQKPEAGN